MNLRLQNYKLYRINGLSCYRAARLAGYSHSYAWNASTRIEKGCKFQELMVKEGLDDQSLMEVIKAGLNVRSSITGQPTLVTKTFVELACKLSGRLKEKDVNIIGNQTIHNHPNKTIVFTDINDLDRETDLQDIHATESESGTRIGQNASSS